MACPRYLRCLRSSSPFLQHARGFSYYVENSISNPTWKRHIEASSESVIFSRLKGANAGITVLALNRAESKNAIGCDMLEKLQDGIQKLGQESSDARVLLVCSITPGVFCAGADLKERKKMNIPEIEKFVGGLRGTFCALEALPLPTIAVIEGAALGGGLELALSCDLRVCGSDAVFGLPETSLAIIPGAGGTQRLPRLIGKSRAKEMIFTGRKYDSETARLYGLVEHAVPSGEAYDKALEIAKTIICQGPLAIKMAKVAIERGSEVNNSSAMAIEGECYAEVLKSNDRLEGLNAFAEKRTPLYKGY